MAIKELLEIYYKGLEKKQGWEVTISDDFKFIGGDMTQISPTVGKQAYIEVIQRFSRLFTGVRTKEMFLSEEGAFVVANYDYSFPNKQTINGDVAELWKVKDGKLDSLTIFFDTRNFQALLKG